MNINTLKKLEKLQITQKEFWNITPEVGNFLSIVIKAANYRNILEVGTSNGYSAIWFASALEKTDGHLVTIEFYDERQQMARKNLEECNLLGRVTFLQGKAVEVLNKLTPGLYNSSQSPFIDFAFIDASKLEYVEYFNLIHPFLKKGGMIVADNVISHEDKVRDYIDLLSSHEDYQSEKINLGAGLLVSLKIK